MTLIAVGTKMPDWVQKGYAEYAKRFPRDFSLNLVEIALMNRGKNADIQRIKEKEGQQILAAIPKGDKVIALEVKGKAWRTEQLADQIKQWRMEGDNISLLIGGPDGLSAQCLSRSVSQWSLSALTLPHPLVRIVVAEQLYRAWTIINNHPYHR